MTGSSSSHSSFNNPFGGNRQTIVTGSSDFGGSSSSFNSPSSFNSGSSFSSGSFSSAPAVGSSFSSAGSSFNSGGSSSFGDDPCSNFKCGSNANCLTRSFRAACACRSGYEGDPYTGCRRSECVGKFHSSSIASNKLQHHDEIWSRSEQKTPNAPAIRSATTSVASIHARPLAVSTPNVPFAITSPFASAPRDSPVIHSSPALHHPAPMSLAARV